MTVFHRRELNRELPGTEWVDVDFEIGMIQGQKSEFEMQLVRESIRMHDNIHAAVPAILRIGRTVKEVSDDLR